MLQSLLTVIQSDSLFPLSFYSTIIIVFRAFSLVIRAVHHTNNVEYDSFDSIDVFVSPNQKKNRKSTKTETNVTKEYNSFDDVRKKAC